MSQTVVSRARHQQAGFALIEVLIAMFLIALWMLASAGTQISSLKFQKSAGNRALAIALASELSERIEANLPGAQSGSYRLSQTGAPVAAVANCNASFCTPAEIASFDLAEWTNRVATTLPDAGINISQGTTASGLMSYTITLTWSERRGRQTYAESAPSETLSYVLVKTVRDASS